MNASKSVTDWRIKPINTYNTLVVVYNGRNYDTIGLKKESLQKVIDFKRNNHYNNNQIKKIIDDIDEVHYSDIIEEFKNIKKEIDEIIILAYNSHPNNYKISTKNYNSESFTDYFEKEQREIKIRTDTLNETYNTVKKNSKGNTYFIITIGSTLLTVYNLIATPTFQNIALPISIAIGSFISSIKDENLVRDLKESYDNKKDKHDTLNNIIDRIKNKDIKLTIIKPIQ